ncbi:hypothetical protein HYS54_04295 [Candidatus Micrarchaeota archaeon]|nr:hypothetical protein [Candidatus Micrarchaeota archaeon]
MKAQASFEFLLIAAALAAILGLSIHTFSKTYAAGREVIMLREAGSLLARLDNACQLAAATNSAQVVEYRMSVPVRLEATAGKLTARIELSGKQPLKAGLNGSTNCSGMVKVSNGGAIEVSPTGTLLSFKPPDPPI